MDLKTLKSVLEIGETIAVEFKRCGNGIESDTYESVCSFLNRFGGDIFLGVLDDGTVCGIPQNAAQDMIKNFISVIGNPSMLSPTVYLSPEILQDEAGNTIIHVHVPPSAEVHRYKKIIYDRVDDADVKVTATGAIAQMYIRKQNFFTEKKIFPYANLTDLRLDLLPKIRLMAKNHAGGNHQWVSMSDMDLLKSAGLYGRDMVTGEEGFNLAAIMLLGKDDVILNISPAYVTDAIVRKVNKDRYDDREIIKTNLIESYERLLEFGKKHLPDKFFLEDTVNISLRNIIIREAAANTLMHREYSSTYTAKFVIEKDCMYVENANRAVKAGYITVDNLEPNPKNPLIAAFFRNIGYAEQLGSGVRNLFKYSTLYSGKKPEFKEGDVFRIIVPLDEAYSFDIAAKQRNADKVAENADKVAESADKAAENADKIVESADKTVYTDFLIPDKNGKSSILIEKEIRTDQEKILMAYLYEYDKITSGKAGELLGVKQRRARAILKEMADRNILSKQGAYRNTEYILKKGDE